MCLTQAQQPSTSLNLAGVRSMMQKQVASGVPSIAIAVAHHGRIVWEDAVGMSDRERRIGATAHTPYYLASISKTITATALLQFVEHNQVDLDRPVNDYLAGAAVHSPMWDVSKATVRRVANHTAGLATLVARLGSEPEVRRAHPRFGQGIVRWTMPGSLGVEGEPFDLAMRLYLHGGTLAGAARAQPAASNRNGVWVAYWVQLQKK